MGPLPREDQSIHHPKDAVATQDSGIDHDLDADFDMCRNRDCGVDAATEQDCGPDPALENDALLCPWRREGKIIEGTSEDRS